MIAILIIRDVIEFIIYRVLLKKMKKHNYKEWKKLFRNIKRHKL
jgi:hypothetical protein